MKKLIIGISSELNKKIINKIKKEISSKNINFKKINIEEKESQILNNLKNINVFITKYYVIPEIFFSQKHSLKLLQLTTADYSFVNLKEYKKRSIIVRNNEGANSVSVAEHIFLLMLSIYRNFPQQLIIKKNKWNNLKSKNQELYGKTIGIVGMGYVGQELAKRCIVFGIKVFYFDIKRQSKKIETKFNIKFINFKKLLNTCDIISINASLTKQSKNMINLKNLKLMKKNSVIVNTSRGLLLDEEDLYKVLKKKKIYFSALDVFKVEPLPMSSNLRKLNNIIMTPHSGPSMETVNKLSKIVATNILSIYKSKIIQSLES